MADALASVPAEDIVINRTVIAKSAALVEKIPLLHRLTLLHNGRLDLRLSLALSRARLHGVLDPALVAAPTDLVADGLLACVGVAELVAVDGAVRSEDRALVELVALLNLHGGLGLTLCGAGVHGVLHPALVAAPADAVADGLLASVGVAEAVAVDGAVGAEDRALVEFIALVEEGVWRGESETHEGGDGEDGELHIEDLDWNEGWKRSYWLEWM